MRHVRKRSARSRNGLPAYPVAVIPLPRVSVENGTARGAATLTARPGGSGIRRQTVVAGLLAACAGLVVAAAVATRW